jgi:hypothetical protein
MIYYTYLNVWQFPTEELKWFNRTVLLKTAAISEPNYSATVFCSSRSKYPTVPFEYTCGIVATSSEGGQKRCSVISRGAESSKKFPRCVFPPTTDLLYFKQNTVRTSLEFFLLILFSSGSKHPNEVKLIWMHGHVMFFLKKIKEKQLIFRLRSLCYWRHFKGKQRTWKLWETSNFQEDSEDFLGLHNRSHSFFPLILLKCPKVCRSWLL